VQRPQSDVLYSAQIILDKYHAFYTQMKSNVTESDCKELVEERNNDISESRSGGGRSKLCTILKEEIMV
jgi:hypothetical protein